MRYAILCQEYYTMLVLRKIMAEVSGSAVFVGWADDRLSAIRLVASMRPSLVLAESELADGSPWAAGGEWTGIVIPIYESLADRGACPGSLVKPVSAGDLKEIMFHLKLK